MKIPFSMTPEELATRIRNNRLLDIWSLVHFSTGVLLGALLPWELAVALMILWEPFEIFILSPLLAKRGIDFGYETWRNSLSDMVVDTLGVALGYALVHIF